jgi:hypothetical protein
MRGIRLNVIAPLLVSLWMGASVGVALGQSVCAGDCPDDGGETDGQVSVGELVRGVNIAMGGDTIDRCPSLDGNGDDVVSVDELVVAVAHSLQGCAPAQSPTPTLEDSPTATPSPTPTSTPDPGPHIAFFGVTLADNSVLSPIAFTEEGVPIYRRSTGRGFILVVEAASGASRADPGRSTFSDAGKPDLQIEVSRPLGNGSDAVCDTVAPNAGGVPGLEPASFEDSPAVVAALNDLGCRFVDGRGLPVGRGCREEACVRFPTGQYGCVSADARQQFCGPIDSNLQFPDGDTFVTARVRDVLGNLGPAAQIVIRVER